MQTATKPADEVIIAEAAAWIVRLQGGGRTPAVEAGFREWLAADPAHIRMFSRATDVWETIPGAARIRVDARRRALRLSAAGWRAALAATACVLILLGSVLVFHAWRGELHTAGTGEQKTIALPDGSTVTLNTNARLRVRYWADLRRLTLERGEAYFEVASDPSRPFLVQSGGGRIVALGTAFLVRRDPAAVAVTLVEGRIEVRSEAPSARPMLLSPGERMIMRADAGVALDRPDLDALLAWRSGRIVFDDATLLDAVGEFNRYNEVRLVIADPALAQLRVSGVFKAREPLEFAEAMTQLHRLYVRKIGSEWVLER